MTTLDLLHLVIYALSWWFPLVVIQTCVFSYIGYKHKQQLQTIRSKLLAYYKAIFPMMVLLQLIIAGRNVSTLLISFVFTTLLLVSPFLAVVLAQKMICLRKSK